MSDVHFLQSAEWEALQTSLGRTVIFREGKGWEYRAIVEKSFGINRLYVPYGPSVTSVTTLRTALKELVKDARAYRAAFVRVQPLGIPFDDKLAKQLHLHKIRFSQPADTRVLDLTLSESELLADMAPNVRNLYHTFRDKGLSYHESSDPAAIEELIRLEKGVAAHNGIKIHEDAYFRAQAKVLLARGSARLHFMKLDGQVVAAVLTYRDDSTVYYAHAAADYEHRRLNIGTAIVASIIMRAKDEGKKFFDLYGITTSDDPKHRWAGFTKFKKTFGGDIVHLNETYELSVNPLPYHTYRVIRSLRQRL